MATIAEQLISSGLQTSQQAPNIEGAISSGVGIAQTMENVQQSRAMLEQKKQQLQMQKFEHVGKMYEAATKMPSGSSKSAFVNDFIPSAINALGLSDSIHPVSQKMLAGEPLLAAYMSAQVKEGNMSFQDITSAMQDPMTLAKIMPQVKQFGDEQLFKQTVSNNLGDLQKAHGTFVGEEGKFGRAQIIGGVKRDTLKETVHNRALGDIEKDPILNKQLIQFNNLQNAKNNFVKGGATPQEFMELQQAVRQNLGIKGQSGVGEREETYLNSVGIKKSKMQQFLTGDPQSILESDPAFANQITNLVDLEMANVKKQATSQLDKKAAGRASFYNKPENADVKQDFQNVIEAQKEQFGADTLVLGGKTYDKKLLKDLVSGADAEKNLVELSKRSGKSTQDLKKLLGL